uniref:Uncharacterized protein n=1 Tax=Panagrolaimus davidi TaxID=227884 RepID=A0A914Q2V7_9BILA
MNAVDWNHPEIAQLIDDHIHQRPGYLSQNAITQAASNILQRDIVRTSVQSSVVNGFDEKKILYFYGNTVLHIIPQCPENVKKEDWPTKEKRKMIKCGNFLDLEEPKTQMFVKLFMQFLQEDIHPNQI